MKALITGAGGQVASELLRKAPRDVDVVALSSRECDITDAAALRSAIETAQPDIVFNAAAYTAVDRAESEPARAKLINGTAVGFLAEICRQTASRLVHISTDFVFDGKSGTPYRPDAIANPINVYGQSKLSGEEAAGCNSLIVRTSWVYSAHNTNFVKSILRLIAERDEVGIVSDQIGSPTQANGLAEGLWGLALRDARGVFHYTDSGVASWYDFAVAIREEALACGLLLTAGQIRPIKTTDYPTAAARPSFSVLDNSETWTALERTTPHWCSNLRDILEELKNDG